MSTTIAIDTGGTFTDAFVVRDGQPHSVKVLTTPHDLAVCFREVIARAAGEAGVEVTELLRDTISVRYATTVGTNAIIQRSGPRLGLVAAPGGERLYADNGEADTVFELFLDPRMVAAVDIDADDLDAAVVNATKTLLNENARGLVVGMPGAHGDASAEQAVRERFEQHYPKHCLDAVPLLLSNEIAADPDDFRRLSTALFNAYVHPDVAGYLYRAEDHLRDSGYRRPLLIVHNDGGAARVAKTIAARTYNSGPTAGLMGAELIAKLYDIDALVTLDMGGTSLDVAFLAQGEMPMREHGRVEGAEVSFPLPDVLTLGAGGGSIAHAADGELRVGPQSAGAKPGPACFGFGGSAPTVTDADVVLGIIDPDRFLGGKMRLDRERAERALGELATELGRDPTALAGDVRDTVHREMGARIAAELAGRGLDPARSVMLGFGGAGMTHACGIAQAAGIGEIVTVPHAAVFSAFGASAADIHHAYHAPPGEGVEERLRKRALRDMRGEGFGAEQVDLQVDEVSQHGEPAVQVTAKVTLEGFEFAKAASNGAAPERGRRDVHWPGSGSVETAIYDAGALTPGTSFAGPAVVEADDTTHAVPAGWSFRVDEYGNARLSNEG